MCYRKCIFFCISIFLDEKKTFNNFLPYFLLSIFSQITILSKASISIPPAGSFSITTSFNWVDFCWSFRSMNLFLTVYSLLTKIIFNYTTFKVFVLKISKISDNFMFVCKFMIVILFFLIIDSKTSTNENFFSFFLINSLKYFFCRFIMLFLYSFKSIKHLKKVFDNFCFVLFMNSFECLSSDWCHSCTLKCKFIEISLLFLYFESDVLMLEIESDK